jgi:hypothetical protein
MPTLRRHEVAGKASKAGFRLNSGAASVDGYAFIELAATVFRKVSSDPRNADFSPDEVWEEMSKKLYNVQMVLAQRAEFISATLQIGETVAELAARLHTGLAEMEGEAGDDVLSQRLVDALPEKLQVHAYGLTGDYDVKIAALTRIQQKIGLSNGSWRIKRSRSQ